MNARNETRKLAFEQCENREMMAGNVAAAMYGDQLVIQGDNQSNSIEVSEIGNNVVQIKAANGTTVNGATTAYFFNPSDKINAFMNGGDDMLIIHNNPGRTTTFNNVYINMGSGRDQLAFWGTSVFGNATVVMGAEWENDADYLDIGKHPLDPNPNSPQANFWANLDVKTGGGDDSIAFREKTNVFGNVSLRTGAGKDSVRIDQMYAARDFFADLGSGDDQMNAGGLYARGNVWIDAGYGYDLYLGSMNYLSWNKATLSRFERINR